MQNTGIIHGRYGIESERMECARMVGKQAGTGK